MIKKQKTTLLLLIVGVIILVSIIVVKMSRLPEISSSTPPTNSTEVLPEMSLIITLDKAPINPTITTSPDVPTKTIWDDKKTTVTITPSPTWTRGVVQNISVLSNNKVIGTISFTTRNFTQTELSEQLQQQSADDAATAKDVTKYLTEKPWINALPIETDSYRIVYDYTLNKLRIRLKTEKDTTNEALTKLTELKIPYQQIGYTVIKMEQQP